MQPRQHLHASLAETPSLDLLSGNDAGHSGHDRCGPMNGPCTLRRSQPSSLHWARKLRPGTPTSPEEDRLWLLPSGPDQVHGSSPRGTQPSSPRGPGSPTGLDLGREFSPARADCGYRAPLAPRLARSGSQYNRATRITPTVRYTGSTGSPPGQDRTHFVISSTCHTLTEQPHGQQGLSRRLRCSWLAGQNCAIFPTANANACVNEMEA